ncbi:MAG: transposase [Clostridia bacterium]|nr:transposase [Clostridia bacterium]
MPRTARIKAPEYIYHIMCRSISEVDLFRDEDDKNYYLGLLKKYTDKFRCKIYAYCLLDTHVHLHFDPQGFDISRFMHCVNVSYVIYYNKKYTRRGHVFQGRYESKVVSSEKYSLALSAYIHNNPKDVEGFGGREYEYPFSSMGIYLGKRKDILELVDTSFILNFFKSKTQSQAVKRYVEFVGRHRDVGAIKNIINCIARNISNVYRDDRKIVFRNIKPEYVVAFLTKRFGLPSAEYVRLKSRREIMHIRAFCVFLQRTFCGYGYKDICKYIGNMSLSGVSRLCRQGFNLYNESKEYRDICEGILSIGQLA